MTVGADQVARTQLFVAAPAGGAARSDLTFTVRALDSEGGSASDHSFLEKPE